MNTQQIYEWMHSQIEYILKKPKDCWKKELTLLQDVIHLKIIREALAG